MKKGVKLFRDNTWVQSVSSIQFPQSYISEPPQEICASVEYSMDRVLNGRKTHLWKKTTVPKEFQGKPMPHERRGMLVLETLALRQSFKNKYVEFKSWTELGKMMGYKDEDVARRKAKEFVRYGKSALIETNFIEEYKRKKGSKRTGIYDSYNNIVRLMRGTYEDIDEEGNVVERHQAYRLYVDDAVYDQWKTKGMMRFLQLKNPFELTDKGLALFLFIANEMLGSTKWIFKVNEVKKIISIFLNDQGRIRQEIRRVMNILVRKNIGITKYDLDNRFLTVYGKLPMKKGKSNKKALESQPAIVEPKWEEVEEQKN